MARDPAQIRLDVFLEALEERWGRDAEFLHAAPKNEQPLHVIVHHGVPVPGVTTSVTYGISLTGPRNEIVLQVDSDDVAWPKVLGRVARVLRERSSLHEGELFDCGGPIVLDSSMSGFFLHRVCDLPEGAPPLRLPDGPVALLQLYPLHPRELDRSRVEGIGWLLAHRAWEPTRVRRPDLA